MHRILFFLTPTFSGASNVTHTIAKKLSHHFDNRFVVINNTVDSEEEIQEAITKHKPEILFCSFCDLNPNVIIEGKKQGLVVIVRNNYILNDISIERKQKIIQTYPLADWVIAQTPEMKQELHETIPGCRIKVIENPIDEEGIRNKASEPNPFPSNGFFHFLWVGRKDPIKDLPILKKAFEIVIEQYPEIDLTLVSDDPNPYRWIRYADCLVISSRSEASPNVLHEAVFLNTEVISTNCSPTVRRLLPPSCIAQVGSPESLAFIMKNMIERKRKTNSICKKLKSV